ncbi:hypothetical protein C8J57DRAFT_1372145 [Mycena rebaudengoi]|nr:hypothetical protein C8J57DRAFT_1372145 [Mycena rebaudengoi]
MWFKLLPLFLLAAYALAQGDDTIGSLTVGHGIFGGLVIDFLWKGEAGHQLNNITMELISGKAEDKGTDVVDIIAVNFSTLRGHSFLYSFHPGTPAGPYHVRMNGTLFNGDTSLSSTVSALSDTVIVTDSGLPCAAGTWTPVRGLTDPAYSPLRLTIQAARLSSPMTVFPQSAVSSPFGGIPVEVSYVDLLFDNAFTNHYNATAEVLNTVTGFNAGVQAATLGGFEYETSNFTLDPGSWKIRMNITLNSTRNPGPFTVYSDKFFVLANASQPDCEHDSSLSSSKNAAMHGWTGVLIGLLLAATCGWF